MSSECPNEEVIPLLRGTPISEEAFEEEEENEYIPSITTMLCPPVTQLAVLMEEILGEAVVRKIVHPEEATFASEEARDRFMKGVRDLVNPLELLREIVHCTESTRTIRQLGKLPTPLVKWFKNTLNNVQVNPALITDLIAGQEESHKRFRVSSLSVLTRLVQVIWSIFGDRVEELRKLFLRSSKDSEDAIFEYYTALTEGRAADLIPVNVMKIPARCSDPTIHALLIYLAFGYQQRFCYQACPLLYQNSRCTNFSAHMMLDLMTAPHGFISLCLLSRSYVDRFEELLKWASSEDDHVLEWAFPAIFSLKKVQRIILYLPKGYQFYQEPSTNDARASLRAIQEILQTYREEWFESLKYVQYNFESNSLDCETNLNHEIRSYEKALKRVGIKICEECYNLFVPYVEETNEEDSSSSSSLSSSTPTPSKRKKKQPASQPLRRSKRQRK